MKQLLLAPILCLLITSTTIAQENFKIPEITDAEKFANMAGQANALIVNSINYAKSLGKSVDDIANFSGEQFKTSWNKEMGFNGFVNGILYNSICFFPKAEISILEQSDKIVKYRIFFDPEFIKSFPMLNVTFEEYLSFQKGVVIKIGEYLGAEYSHELKDNVLYVTIKKK